MRSERGNKLSFIESQRRCAQPAPRHTRSPPASRCRLGEGAQAALRALEARGCGARRHGRERVRLGARGWPLSAQQRAAWRESLAARESGKSGRGAHEAAPGLFGVDDLLDLVDELLHLLRRGAAPVPHRRLGVHQLRPQHAIAQAELGAPAEPRTDSAVWAAESRTFPSRVTSKLPVVPGSAVDEISRSSPNSSTSCFSSATKYLWPTAIERLSSAMKTQREGGSLLVPSSAAVLNV